MSNSWDVDCYPEPGEYPNEGTDNRAVETEGLGDKIAEAFGKSMISINVFAFFFCLTYLILGLHFLD